MIRRILFFMLLVISFSPAFAQAPKLITVSTLDFTAISGTPRVIANDSNGSWVVAWRQAGAIKVRTIKPDGTMTAPKNVATGASNFEQNFDLAYNRDNFTYLLAFENGAGLQVRAVNASLGAGATHSIEAGAKGSTPRLIYDPVGKRYFIYWLGSSGGTRSELRVRLLDTLGNPTASTVDLTSAGAGKTFGSLNVARNPQNGNMTAILLQQSGAAGAVLKVNVGPNGTLMGAPAAFQGPTAGLQAIGDAVYSSPGVGFGLWSDKTAVKRRKVTSTGGFGSGIAAFANTADTNSLQASITFNSTASQFVGVWSKANQTFAVNLNGTTGVPVKAPAAIASSTLSFSRNANLAADSAGNVLVVWEDSSSDAAASNTTTKFRIRGGIIATTGGGGGGGGTANVDIVDDQFQPNSITITAGTKVIWTHRGAITHTVTSDSPGSQGSLFNSGNLSPGQTFSFTATSKGTITYHCLIHGTFMSGTIQVN